MNKSDSERIAGYLEKHGYAFSENKDKADLVVVTTCGVRQSAEDRVYGLIPRIKRNNPEVKVVLTGCLSGRADVKKRLKEYVDIWMPITELSNLANKLDKTKTPENNSEGFVRSNLARSTACHPVINSITYAKNLSSKYNNTLKDVEVEGVEPSEHRMTSLAPHLVTPTSNSLYHSNNYFKINPKHNSGFSAFVPIGNGCDNFCTYCVVPHARGREVYRDADEILKEVEELVNKGYKEIILIAQNVNSYKCNANPQIDANQRIANAANNETIKFPDLLRMVNNIDGNFWIRFATSHPKDMSYDLIKVIAECDKVCEHIHLPVQAGDDEILRRMNRKYTAEHYINLIKKIRKSIPDASITTDTIVGFPGESKEQFNNTKKLFKEVKFDMAYIAQYSPRPGTAAAKMEDDAPKKEKKRREEELMDILRKTASENNKKYIGKTVDVLVERKNKKGEWFGKTRTFKNVECRMLNAECSVGYFVKVKIKKANDFGMVGIISS